MLCAVSGSDLKLHCISRNTRLQGNLTILGQTAPLKEPDLLYRPWHFLRRYYAFSQALSRSILIDGLTFERVIASGRAQTDARGGVPL